MGESLKLKVTISNKILKLAYLIYALLNTSDFLYWPELVTEFVGGLNIKKLLKKNRKTSRDFVDFLVSKKFTVCK